ncbi:unnamed protein product [Peronospora farinosa]|uniref:Fcf2 pre-rRNA processing C-terminal domain-containing protein n=1 Tax=Peronospora farinosa TaxID=134698 RepID=A0ABN8C117_9STRA|nr:unnamed protein product [Peronospora farinosa]
MVETRRTSRRLQAKAEAEAAKMSSDPSPMNSPSGRSSVCNLCRSPSPQKNQEPKQEEEKKNETNEKEKNEKEKNEEDENEKDEKEKNEKDEEDEKEKEKDAKDENEKNEKDGNDMDENDMDENEKDGENEKDEKQTETIQLVEVMESEPDTETEPNQETMTAEEEEEEEEDVDQYALLAASGLNLSTKTNKPSSSSPLTSIKTCTSAKSSTAAFFKRRLVPNQLDSGASQYQEFFNFDGSKRSTAAVLRADARALEEAKVIAAGQKAVAHSERQRAESLHKKSAGRRWFNFESEEMTTDARRDFALLRMRNYLDPKKFYKSSDHSRALPKHFQMGVVIEGAHEFHSARLTKKQRRKTFTDEIMADEAVVQYTHRVASNIQAARSNQGRKKRRRN